MALDVWRKYGESSKIVIVDGWKLPPIDILDKAQEVEFSDADNQQRADMMALEFSFLWQQLGR